MVRTCVALRQRRDTRREPKSQHVRVSARTPVCRDGVRPQEHRREDDGMSGASGARPDRLRQSLRQHKALGGNGVDGQARGASAACRLVPQRIKALGINLLPWRMAGPPGAGPHWLAPGRFGVPGALRWIFEDVCEELKRRWAHLGHGVVIQIGWWRSRRRD